MNAYKEAVLAAAREFVFSPLGYHWTDDERRAIEPFFSNLNTRAYFMHSLPANIGATLLAMFSRMKDPRGLRGVWAGSFLPQFLATQLTEVERDFGGDETKFLKAKNIKDLADFLACSAEAHTVFKRFLLRMGIDSEYLARFAESKKARRFLSTWLDKYGHNSIARMGSLWLGFEEISLLAAKSIEWNRPGSGYIELSTRYVDMSAKGCYPIEKELGAGWGVDGACLRSSNDLAFQLYREMAGENFHGPFPAYLREQFGDLYTDAPRDLEAGVIGETCDVLGNLLPASALTSVGVCVSGEAFPMLLKHLLLDNTPENIALVDLVLQEAQKVGAQQFARHYQPTPWDVAHWQYLPGAPFSTLTFAERTLRVEPLCWLAPLEIEELLCELLDEACPTLEEALASARFLTTRGEHDKLPAEFEAVSLAFEGVMSFRGWRDLHRQGYCAHFRTYLTPDLGFYRYDKPAPSSLQDGFARAADNNRAVYRHLAARGVPLSLRQYPLALGNLIGFRAAANLRQWEFCNWQRTSYSVNHEVRQVFLAIEEGLRELFHWWPRISRADTTPAYVFARGEKAIPLAPR